MQEKSRNRQVGGSGHIKGVLFDVDGTLYWQTPLRAIMAASILWRYISAPGELYRRVKIVKAYRRAQETLRKKPDHDDDCPEKQIRMAADTTGETRECVANTIKTWFEQEPLKYLPFCRRRGVRSVLEKLRQNKIKLGVFSDYPAADKLQALGIAHYFSTVVTAGDPEVTGFKPFSNGFQVAARKMGLAPSEVLYVGDRPAVDGDGASRAGMAVAIIRARRSNRSNYHTIRSFYDIWGGVFGGGPFPPR